MVFVNKIIIDRTPKHIVEHDSSIKNNWFENSRVHVKKSCENFP